jgi:translation initiation factor 1A
MVLPHRKNKGNKTSDDGGFIRVRIPKEGEILGVVEQRLGAGRMRVRCFDSNTRICRIPGALKRFLWVRESDIVLITPWELEPATKADVVYKYKPNQVSILKQKGYLDNIDDFRDF